MRSHQRTGPSPGALVTPLASAIVVLPQTDEGDEQWTTKRLALPSIWSWRSALTWLSTMNPALRGCSTLWGGYWKTCVIPTIARDCARRMMRSCGLAVTVTTVADHRIKLAFIAKHQMGDGMDWTKQLLADAERIAAIHADANNIVVPFVSSRYPADIAPPLTFDAAAPMRDLLDQRNAVAAWMNRDSVSTDAEVEPFCDTLNGIERTITGRAAMTTDDAIAKLITVVQVAAEGSEVREEEACCALIDARRVFGLGYIHDFMLAHMTEVPPAVAALPSAEAGLNVAWAEATADWQAVRQEMSVEQLSDDQLDALVEREMQAFCKLADLPLRDHRDVMTRLRAMLDVFPNVPPDPVNKLIDEVARMSAIPPRGDDRILLDAFADRRRQFVENHAVILTADAEDAYFARLDGNDETLLKGSAVSIPGVLAKLRVAFTQLEPNAWSDQAIGDPAGTQFREGLHMSDMYVRMLWSAIEDLARISGVDMSEQAK